MTAGKLTAMHREPRKKIHTKTVHVRKSVYHPLLKGAAHIGAPIGAPNCEGTFIGARGTICGGAICAQPICNGGVAPPFNGFIFLRSSFDFLMFFTCCSSA